MSRFTAEQKFKAARREMLYRQLVYDRLIVEGKMSPELAKRQIALMQEIAEDYEKLAEKERLL